jgi:hypothetical protein
MEVQDNKSEIERLLQAPRKGYHYEAERVTKFHYTIHIYGFFQGGDDKLIKINLVSGGLLHQISEVGPLENVADKGSRFKLQALFSSPKFPEDAVLVFETQKTAFASRLRDLINKRTSHYRSPSYAQKLLKHLQALPSPKMLDVGGRDRGGVDRSKAFPGVDVTVMDILPSENVDVVGDAHCLSKYFPRNHFDGVHCVAVFEHLLMPWKVAVEMNKVMKPGALGYVWTHQTFGMHDLPWDFWRMSDSAWPAFFNKRTGFEIVECLMEDHHYVLPFLCYDGKEGAEGGAGFGISCVLFRKIGESQLDWDIGLDEITETMYPE